MKHIIYTPFPYMLFTLTMEMPVQLKQIDLDMFANSFTKL